MMHIFEHHRSLLGNSKPLLHWNIKLALFHMKQIEKTALIDVLKNYIDIRYFWNHSHQDANVRVAEDALHYDFVLDLL
jgi:hypothetical protein